MRRLSFFVFKKSSVTAVPKAAEGVNVGLRSARPGPGRLTFLRMESRFPGARGAYAHISSARCTKGTMDRAHHDCDLIAAKA